MMNYALAYAVGFHPWEDAEKIPAFTNRIEELWDREEQGREAPFGRALDVGTGSGIWGIQLSQRGWQVTGIDLVAKALRRARIRAQEAAVELNLVHGDVTKLRETGAGAGFRLVLDTGTFHGLDDRARAAMGAEVSAVATDDATVLLLAWNPRRRGPLPHGASLADIETAFPDWKVSDEDPTGYPPPKPLRADETWYRLRRA
jgi:SAM-dependent methyltransferase